MTMVRSVANRWRGVGSAYPRGLFRAGNLGCWFDCAFGDAWANTGRTIPAAVGQAVLALTGRIGGLHGLGGASGLRPFLARLPVGGRRNQFLWSDAFSNALWVKSGLAVSTNPDGSTTLTDTAEVGYHVIYSQALTPTGGVHTRSIDVKIGNQRYACLSFSTFPSSAQNTWIFDMATGSFTQVATLSLGQTAVNLGDGWWRVSITAETSAPSNGRLTVGSSSVPTGFGASLQYAGVGDTILIRRAQGEDGLAPTPYQNVTTLYDVSEAAKPSLWHLFSDQIDDTMTATLPNLGASATVFFANESGSTILSNQTIGAGAFAVLRGQRTYACGAINRSLTTGEQAGLRRYLDAQRGA